MKTWLACLFVFVAAAPLSAQQSDPPGRRADFLFGRPKAAIALRGSWIFARAGSDLFDFVTEQLTLDKDDFNGPAVAADLAIAITPRFDAQFGFELSRMHASSEYRDLVDNLFLPIEQQTRLKTIHLIGGVRYALAPKGYEVSRLAWVPRR